MWNNFALSFDRESTWEIETDRDRPRQRQIEKQRKTENNTKNERVEERMKGRKENGRKGKKSKNFRITWYILIINTYRYSITT